MSSRLKAIVPILYEFVRDPLGFCSVAILIIGLALMHYSGKESALASPDYITQAAHIASQLNETTPMRDCLMSPALAYEPSDILAQKPVGDVLTRKQVDICLDRAKGLAKDASILASQKAAIQAALPK